MGTPPDDDLDALFARARADGPPDPEADELVRVDTDFDPEPEPFEPREELAAQQRRARVRTWVTLGLAALVLAAGWLNRDELTYALDGPEPLALGDFDALIRQGKPVDAAFQHNRFARYEMGRLVEEREGAPGVYYFFEPSANLIVITRRALPEKGGHNVPVHAAYVPLLVGKWVLPEDLTATFGAQGRLLRADLAPRRFRHVVDYYRDTLLLDSRRPGAPIWLLEDGMAPADHRLVLALFAGALGIVALSAGLTWRARRDARRFAEAVADLERAPG